jgi:hypothetical protein
MPHFDPVGERRVLVGSNQCFKLSGDSGECLLGREASTHTHLQNSWRPDHDQHSEIPLACNVPGIRRVPDFGSPAPHRRMPSIVEPTTTKSDPALMTSTALLMARLWSVEVRPIKELSA